MARAGDVLEDPAKGDRLVFLRTAAETGGELLEYELTFVPRGFAVRDHLHPRQSERHEVLDGSLGLIVGGRELRLGAGDGEDVPAATRHRIFATQGAPLRARFALRPALESEVLLETLFGLARDGKVGRSGNPSPLQLAVIFSEFAELGRPPKPPAAVQRTLLAPLSALGRGRGYRARYPEYSEGVRETESGEYVFIDEWHVDAPPEAVFDALADATTYPEWWRPVYIETTTDGPPEVGRRRSSTSRAGSRITCTPARPSPGTSGPPSSAPTSRATCAAAASGRSRRATAAPMCASTGASTPRSRSCGR